MKPHYLSLFILHLSFLTLLSAQNDTINRPPVDIHFLFHYYEQDGVHSAVTGGEGTQQLTDRSSLIVVKAPIDSFRAVHAHGGQNTYSSASTDRIDSRLSSASSKDTRARMYLGYSWTERNKPWTWYVEGGGSIESDYTSTSLQLRYSRRSINNDWEWSIGLNSFFDTWVVYVPDELRGTARANVPTDKRRSFNLSFAYIRVLNRRMQALFSFEPSYQSGLLATPFHRTFFENDPLAFVESLPGNRWKLPLSARAHVFVSPLLVLRGQYRYYWDSFGIQAHSISLKAPVKLGNYLSIAPAYRWHSQTAARYFRPFAKHVQGNPFFTSDYDLSAFSSHQISIHGTWNPLYSISKFKFLSKNYYHLESIDLSYNRFIRSDGLTSFWMGIDLGFSLHH